MAILIKQELYKLFKRKKTLVVIVAFILLTAFLTHGIKQSADFAAQYNTDEFRLENLEWELSYLESDIDNVPEELENNEEDLEFYQENIRREIERVSNEIERLKENMDRDLSWQEALAEDIQYREQMIEEGSLTMDSNEISRLNLELDELKYLQDNNIEPQEEYTFNAFIQIKELMENIGQIFLVIGISVFAADMVSGEWTPPTMKLLLTQPVSRKKVLLSKFIATIIAAVGLILIIEIASFIIVGLTSGFGNMDYPAVINKAYEFDNSIIIGDGTHPISLIDGSWDLIPVWKYTLMAFGYQALFIIATVSLVFMISSLAKSTMVALAVSVVGLIAASVIFQVSRFYGAVKYAFITYSSIENWATGSLPMYYNDPSMTASAGLIVIIAWIIVCYIISHIIFTKRDMLV